MKKQRCFSNSNLVREERSEYDSLYQLDDKVLLDMYGSLLVEYKKELEKRDRLHTEQNEVLHFIEEIKEYIFETERNNRNEIEKPMELDEFERIWSEKKKKKSIKSRLDSIEKSINEQTERITLLEEENYRLLKEKMDLFTLNNFVPKSS